MRSAEARSCAVLGFCSTNHGKLLKGVRSLWQLCLEWSEGGQSSGHQCGGWHVVLEGEDSGRNCRFCRGWPPAGTAGGQPGSKAACELDEEPMWEGREGCSQSGLRLLAWGARAVSLGGGWWVSQMVGGGQGLDFSPVGFELLRDACEGMIQAVGHQGLGCRARSRLESESWESLDLGGG